MHTSGGHRSLCLAGLYLCLRTAGVVALRSQTPELGHGLLSVWSGASKADEVAPTPDDGEEDDNQEDEIEESNEDKPDLAKHYDDHTPNESSGEILKATQKVLVPNSQSIKPDETLTCKSFKNCEECVNASLPDGCAWIGKSCSRKDPNKTYNQQCFVQYGDPRAAASRLLWHLLFFEKIDKSMAAEAIAMMEAARALLMEENSKRKYRYLMTEVDKDNNADVFVFGDIHGSAYSIVPILRGLLYGLGKDSPCRDGEDTEDHRNACLLIDCRPGVQYVFLGDYIDRGEKMLGTAVMVMSLKLLCPQSVTVLRGNHETPTVNARYGFLEELREEWDGADEDDPMLVPDQWGLVAAVNHLDNETFMKSNGPGLNFWFVANRAFGALPISALIKGKVWCMHGGPPEGGLRELENPPPLPELGEECVFDYEAICQLMWNDVYDADFLDWEHNDGRGIAKAFGRRGLEELLDEDNLDLILRGHDYIDGVQTDGFECLFENQICTLFSAAQYMASEKVVRHVNHNPGAVFWLHGPAELKFRRRRGVKVTDLPLQRGKLLLSGIAFDGIVLRHVAKSLGCQNCLDHIPTSERMAIRYAQRTAKSRELLMKDRMVSNTWVAEETKRAWIKKKSTDLYCDGGLGTANHTLVGDWSTTKKQCKSFCDIDISCNFITYFNGKADACSSDACLNNGQPRRCRLSEVCSTASTIVSKSKTVILEKKIVEKDTPLGFELVQGAKVCALQQDESIVKEIRTIKQCKEACSRDSACVAVNWFPAKLHCYLRTTCDEIQNATKRATLYLKVRDDGLSKDSSSKNAKMETRKSRKRKREARRSKREGLSNQIFPKAKTKAQLDGEFEAKTKGQQERRRRRRREFSFKIR